VKTDTGDWKIDYASDGLGTWNVTYVEYGGTSAHPVPADYDGDGRDDLSVKADFGGGIWFIDYADFYAEETGAASKFDQYTRISTPGVTEAATVSGVASEESPDGFKLGPNYPNPFNPSTTISFSLPEQAEVHLVVHDVLGRQVDLLADDLFETGTHNVTFDASNLASGVYLVRARISTASGESHVLTKRITLLK
jgi:hypothetical protein